MNDLSLNSGERQVSPTIDGIRRDHVARYEWAANIIKPNCRIIDFACGIGYGTKILADAEHTAMGYDISQETIEYAADKYNHFHATFAVADANYPQKFPDYDVAISFETIEHVQDPRNLLLSLRCAPMLIASVPNESVLPWYNEEKNAATAFHYRHYTKDEFAELLMSCGWHPVSWYGQLGPESEVELNVHGRTLIAVCERVAIPEPRNKDDKGLHIAVLGLGPSLDQYLEITKRQGGRSAFCDETWAINALGDVFACDLIFHMDDIRIQEIRAAARPASNIARMVDWLKASKTPVVTSRKHPDYPALMEFPLEDVLNNLGHDYFNSTAAYAIALAIHVGATKISCFGLDYTYPNASDAEKGRACVEFWLGQAHARGIKINLPKTTTLMDSMYPRSARLYGYDTVDIDFNVAEDGHLKLGFTEREKLPTAAEIEANYDHSAPIAKQHQSTKE